VLYKIIFRNKLGFILVTSLFLFRSLDHFYDLQKTFYSSNRKTFYNGNSLCGAVS